MTLQLTEDQRMVQELARSFAEREAGPRADELDKTGRFPAQSIQKMAEIGLMGLTIPERYGGAGLDELCKVLAITEIARGCASTAEILAVHSFVSEIILKHGSEAQKEKYLPLAAGGGVGAFALTEPNAGSDAGSIRTRAVPDGDGYILDGSKCFISNMGEGEGDYVVVFALTDPEKGTRGMTAFLLDRDTPGFRLGKTEEKMGLRGAAVSELIFDGCRVPDDSVLGQVGAGFQIAMSGLDGGRVGIAAQSVGLARAALDEAVIYAKQRIQFGRPIAEQQGIQWYLADMATRIEAAQGLVYAAADLRMRGEPAEKAASMAKYYASETAVYVAGLALQIHGGYGYMKDYPIERIYRDARILTIYEGTSEIQKLVIARRLLREHGTEKGASMDRTRNPFVWIAALMFRYGWCCFIAVPVLYLVEAPALKFLLIAAGLLISLRVPFLFDVCSLLLIMALLERLSADGALTVGWYLFFGAYSFLLSLNVQQHYRRFRQRPGVR